MKLMPTKISSKTELISHEVSIPWNRCLGSLRAYTFGLSTLQLMLSAVQAAITLITELTPGLRGEGKGEWPSRKASLVYLESYAALDVCRVALAGIL